MGADESPVLPDLGTCQSCGREKPERAYLRGWRRGLCAWCYFKAQGYEGTSTERTRRYRTDPEKRELDRECARRWKREHLGQPGLPRRAQDG
jgi:hypothetical protein